MQSFLLALSLWVIDIFFFFYYCFASCTVLFNEMVFIILCSNCFLYKGCVLSGEIVLKNGHYY